MKYGAVEIAGKITREILADVYLQKERLPDRSPGTAKTF